MKKAKATYKIPWRKSLNGRLFFFFLVGAIIMITISYPILNTVTSRLLNNQKKESIEAELGQISTGIRGITATLERYMNSLILNPSLKALANREFYDDLEIIKEIRTLGAAIETFLTGAPYLHSIYIVFPDQRMITFTNKNLQQQDLNTTINLSENLKHILQVADKKIQYVGNVTAKDFPLQLIENDIEREKAHLLSAILNYKNTIIIINANEDQLEKEYANIANLQNQILIVNESGKITSAYKKETIGQTYHYFQEIKNSNLNMSNVQHQKEQKHIYWQHIPSLNMTLLYEANMSRYYAILKTMNNTILITLIGVFVLLCLVCLLWLRHTIKPIFSLVKSMKKVEVGDYRHKVEVKGENELALLTSQHNIMLEGLEALTRENQLAQQAKQESELKALRNQINPHFLLNTLNTIKWMALMHGDNHVAEAISSLGGLIAPLLKSQKNTCTLAEECKLLDRYISIMNMRYDGKVIYEKKIPEELMNAQVLRLMLQPLVENSIIHGFAALSYPGTIILEAYQENDQLIMNVFDNGTGLKQCQIEQLNDDMLENNDNGGIGVRNTNRRIKLNFGEKYGVTFQSSQEEGVCTSISMPLLFEETEEGSK